MIMAAIFVRNSNYSATPHRTELLIEIATGSWQLAFSRAIPRDTLKLYINTIEVGLMGGKDLPAYSKFWVVEESSGQRKRPQPPLHSLVSFAA